MASVAEARKAVSLSSPAVARLRILAKFIDELDRDLDRVPFLEDDIVDSRRFQDIADQAKNAKAALKRTRDAIAEQGGGVVAKGYK